MQGTGADQERAAATGRRLGPFSLEEVIGRGASGEVWRGLHQDQGLPVAIKVLNATRGHDPQLLESFRNEVRAVAGLDHPSIIAVLDHGVLPAELGEIGPQGAPYLVMELATGGSLKSHCGRVSWDEAHEVLAELLSALAHAHARGVIHRDIKPGNVLLGGLRPGIKLTDFGLAQLFEVGGNGQDDIAGTPAYMAPEQFLGHMRDLGPWTDLYAIGCFTWALVCGSPPFGRQSPLEARRGHLYRPLPALEPVVAVPAGLEDWLHRLLEKDPGRRFRRAADALWALSSLGAPVIQPTRSSDESPDESPTVLGTHGSNTTLARSLSTSGRRPRNADTTLSGRFDAGGRTWKDGQGEAWTLTGEQIPSDLDEETSAIVLLQHALHNTRPPPPQDWRREGEGERPVWMGLGAVGLHLFGVRSVPMIGRGAERDQLWSTLLAVCREERPGAVILVGPAGCGKTRLAEWLCERAHEAGAADVFRALHSPHGGPSHGLAAMLARALRTQGLGPEETTRRVQLSLAMQGISDPVEVATVATLLQGTGESGTEGALPPGAVRFSSPIERYTVLRRFLVRSATIRPALVWLDDVAWGLDALRFAASVLDDPDSERSPILFVMTAREEALPEHPMEAEQLGLLERRPDVQRLQVGPLEPAHHRALVESLLGLEGDLAARVEERTAGNPLFAVQLIGDWVERGLLIPGPGGFQLRDGASMPLPEDLAHVWQERVERLLQDQPASQIAREALELAATLGQDVDPAEWEACCREAGLEAPWPLIDTLVSLRLARPAEGGVRVGFSFVHGMLRESLLAHAQAAGRLQSHHRFAAAALMSLRESEPWISLAERVGRHLLEGGDPEGALTPLLEAATRRISGGDYRQAEVLLLERQQALKLALLAPSDPRNGEGEIPLSRALHHQGRFSEAEERARLLVPLAARYGWAELGRLGRFTIAHLTRMRGLYAEAMAEQERLEPEARAAGDHELLLKVLKEKGRIRLDQGDLLAAASCFQEAYRISLTLSSIELEALCLRDLSNLHLRAGRHSLALQHMKAARARFARSGNRWGIADAFNMLGEVDREQGRLDRAEARYRESIERFSAIGSFDVIIPRLNLANVLLLQGQLSEVPPLLLGCVAFARRLQSRNLEAMARGLLLVYSATAHDWTAWARDWAALEALLAEADCVEVDLAASLELAGQRAAGSGAHAVALAAIRLAATCWSALRRPEDAARANALLDVLLAEGSP